MSIPNKQIGWSNESNLLWQIAKQIERLTGITANITPGGGGGAEIVTKSQIDTLIGSSSLVPGTIYIISGVDVPLYGGTTVILKAATANKLELAGHGVFYNPKYLNSQFTPYNGYGVWSNYINLTMSNIVGIFFNGNTVTANNGATATYIANNFLQWISGDWSLATSIDNGDGATADVTGGVSPSYAIGQDVIWGGKHWTNATGNVGSSIDKYTLSADWTVVPFNDVDYNVVVDIIHYDYEHDMIVRRKDKWDNDVDGSFQVFDEFANPDGYDYGNPIKDFQWGNGPEDWTTDEYWYLGVQGNHVKDSYFDCLNFIGSNLWFNTLTQFSYIQNNITNEEGEISYNTLLIASSIRNTLLIDSRISYNKIRNSSILLNTLSFNYSSIESNEILNSNVDSNILTSGASIQRNFIMNSYVQNNNMNTSCIIGHNNLYDFSYISSNTMSSGSSIYSNTESGNSYISGNVLIGGQIGLNEIHNASYIQNNSLTNTSIISSNKLINSSFIEANTLSDDSNIRYNELANNSIFNFSSSGTLTSKTISNIEASFADATFNISAATIIYGDYSKQMFKNSAGVARLGYYNASDVFTIVNVNA